MGSQVIPAIIVLIAGVVTSIINIVNQVELVPALKRLLLVMVIFYFIGQIAKAIIQKQSDRNQKLQIIKMKTSRKKISKRS